MCSSLLLSRRECQPTVGMADRKLFVSVAARDVSDSQDPIVERDIRQQPSVFQRFKPHPTVRSSSSPSSRLYTGFGRKTPDKNELSDWRRRLGFGARGRVMMKRKSSQGFGKKR